MADVNLALDLTLGVSERVSHRVRKFSFGDGYEQIAADGIHSRMTEYEITTRPLNEADANGLQSNLDKVAIGDFFLITLSPFSNEERRYRLKDNSYDREFLPNSQLNYQVFQFVLIESHSD
tara:strand:- start:211 stop:573 length:363 start_codon:yes stop_codon:yes gene_type:complete